MAEPCSTGIGGDMFCLFYDATTRKISAMNGSGRSGAKCTLEQIRKDIGLSAGQTGVKIPLNSVHSVTVPGAPAGWVDTVERFGSGKVTMEQILAPSIEMGENGFPVSEIAGYHVRFFFPMGIANTYANCPSGHKQRKLSKQHPPTSLRCSKPMLQRQIHAELPNQVRSSRTQPLPTHFAHLQRKARRGSTQGALRKPSSKSARTWAAIWSWRI